MCDHRHVPHRPPHTEVPQDQPQDKAALRRRMRMVREMVDDRLVRSVELWSAVAALPEYQAAATVMAFHGFGTEPDTDPLFARLAAEGKRLLLPRIQDDEIAVVDGSGPTVKTPPIDVPCAASG